MNQLTVSTQGNNDVLNITDDVAEYVEKYGIKNGICVVFVSHSTCALTTIEFEPGLVEDIAEIVERIAPSNTDWRHNERWGDGNGHAHLRASLVGPSLSIPISDGAMQLGRWQQIVLIDFDTKPRDRTIIVEIIESGR